jgi:FixJ family two-component response regulator
VNAKPQVYIVDDDCAVRDALQATLSLLDADVHAFGSAEEFLASYHVGCESCLVLDLRMPETSGLELLKITRERDPLLPVIIVSGQGSIADAVSAMKLGAVEFLEKPDCILTLRERVKLALHRNQISRRQSAGQAGTLAALRALPSDELSVLQATASGAQDKAIALRFDVSVRTIQLRRARAMKKLGVRTKAELIRAVHVAELHQPMSAQHLSP